MKEDWREYVSFSRKERNGVIVLLILVVLMSVLPYFIPAPEIMMDEAGIREWQSKLAAWKHGTKKTTAMQDTYKASTQDLAVGRSVQDIASTQSEQELFAGKEQALPTEASTDNEAGMEEETPGKKPDAPPLSLFPFDPNQLAAQDWQRLGIPDKVIRTIFNYLNKGGKFRRPDDIARIYGMRETDVRRLMPYVRIPGQSRPPHNWNGAINRQHPHPFIAGKPGMSRGEADLHQQRGITVPLIRKKKFQYIEINTADTSAWMTFPGIGSRLASRIVQYREKLGGFHSPDQVGETWALPDSTFQKIRPWLQCLSGVFRKIRINTAGVEELRLHPYLRWQLANAIVQFREQHGAFHTATDLQRIILITPLLISKIAPYIEY